MNEKAKTAGAASAWLVSLGVLLYGPGQSDFVFLLATYAVAFGAYLYLLKCGRQWPLSYLLLLAVVARLLAVPAWPQLSDDIYRFVWDGRLLVQAWNPFEHLPSYYLSLDAPPAGITPDLYEKLNSPEYFTVYPPVAQAVFALGAWIFPNSLWGHALVVKLFLLACSFGTIFLLPKMMQRLGLPQHRAAIYLLNPLVIVEIIGNLHFEGAMVFFLLLAFWWLSAGKWPWSALAMSLSVAAKLLPLIFLPFFVKLLGWRRSLAYFAIVGVSLLLLFAPLLSEAFLAGFSSSLDLYFRRFEFNASVYYLLRWVGYQVTGYNEIALIGPALALCTFVGIVLAAAFQKRNFPLLPADVAFSEVVPTSSSRRSFQRSRAHFPLLPADVASSEVVPTSHFRLPTSDFP
ncbi:MAG: hypothetical protein GVY26_05470, partial [Bacteroidetes bacterium]|nr:hypothetical protein [Bacteroidota bacterium]